jgi:hypothetical protein
MMMAVMIMRFTIMMMAVMIMRFTIMMMAVMIMRFVMMMMRMDIFARFLNTINADMDTQTTNAQVFNIFQGIFDVRDAKMVEFIHHFLWIIKKREQRSREHISRSAHLTFEIQRVHDFTS